MPPLSKLWTDFRDGFVLPSPKALALTLGVTGSLWVGTGLVVTPERMARHGHWFASHAQDTYAFVTQRSHAARLATASDVPQLFFTGASGLIYGISRMEHIEAHVEEALGLRPEATSLLTADQSILECLALLESLPERFDGVVFVGVNPYRLGRDLAGRKEDGTYEVRLGLRTDVVERANADSSLVPRPGYFWENFDYFVPRVEHLLSNVRTRAPKEFLTRLDEPGGRHVPRKRWEEHTAQMKHVPGNLRARGPRNLNALAAMGRRVRERGDIEIVLIEAPMSPRAAREMFGEAFLGGYRRRLEAFCSDNGFHYWDLNEEAGLTDEDFYDWTHLNRATTRSRYAKVLADRVVELLGDSVGPR